MDIRIGASKKYYVQLLIIVLLFCVFIFSVSGCGGGFQDDSENVSQFEDAIFNPEKVVVDTTK